MTYYCKYCDRLVTDLEIAKNHQGVIVWIGCKDCYQKKLELGKKQVPQLRRQKNEPE